MNYPYFGFTQPGTMPGQSQNPLMNPGSSYLGAMPAALGGVGASPMASLQSAPTPNMNALMPMGMLGAQLLASSRQQPGQPPSMMQQMMPSMMGVAGLLGRNPNLLSDAGGGMSSMLNGLLGKI